MKIEVYTPDGYQSIGKFVEKGVMGVRDYIFSNREIVSATDTHRFQLSDGKWIYAKDAKLGQFFISEEGVSILLSVGNRREEPVCDIEIKHPNHRYFTNGISSHNTGGNALRYYLSVRYVSKFSSQIKEQTEDSVTGEVQEERTANKFILSCIKNKINDKVYQKTPFVVKFGQGIDDFPILYDILQKAGVIWNKGSFMYYKTSDGEDIKELGKIAFKDRLRKEYFGDMEKQYIKLKNSDLLQNSEDEDVLSDNNSSFDDESEAKEIEL